MSDEILRSSAALNALKRHQLVSLSKRYGLKASGKNVEMIDRLQDYAVTHAGDLDFYIPEPAPTPAPTLRSSTAPLSEPSSPFDNHQTQTPRALMPTPLQHKISKASFASTSRPSDAWEVLSESGASLISPKKPSEENTRGMIKSDSMRSWKSADNGGSLTEFGGNNAELPRSTSSMKALASSLTRRGSRILLGRSTSASSRLDLEPSEPAQAQEEERVEEVVDEIPPSPASTVGVPRRHSTISILERSSTIRLCSPTPTSPSSVHHSDHDPDSLPFFGKAKNVHSLKERRSMAPLHSPTALPSNALTRKSMPAISNSNSASISSIYPPLPSIPVQHMKTTVPGAFPPLPPTPQTQKPSMVFGSGAQVSNQQFSEAAQAILREMNSKSHGITFGEELLKGKKAEMDKLVHVNKDLGTGGWGLGLSGSSIHDRYAKAHEKEFEKMRSISNTSVGSKPPASRSFLDKVEQMTATGLSTKRKLSSSTSTSALPSAPNGLPLNGEARDDGRTKRKRLSNGPNYLGNLKEAGKSIANLIGEEKGKSGDVALRKMKERREKRRSSLVHNTKSKSTTSRFGFFRSKKVASDLAALTSSTLSTSYVVPTPTMPRKTSVYAPRELPLPKKSFDLEASLARKLPVRMEALRSPEGDHIGQAQKDRSRSTSAQTMLSTVSSEAKRRARIPDFIPPSAYASTPGLASSKAFATSSSSLALSMRKQSQADIIRNARPAPPPPALTTGPLTSSTTKDIHSRPTSVQTQRSSTLYLPTASSMARMQATIRPNPDRPLPAPPTSVGTPQTARLGSTHQPFGNASSRNNLFETNFNITKPTTSMAPPSLPILKNQISNGALKTPLKSKSAARLRARGSGLSAVKSRGNMKDDIEVKRKRSEIRARQGRIAEERELREMLSAGSASGSWGMGNDQENVDVDMDM